jgi:NAD(P)-dependent dehydrogenase (short-subunit alcohol dehydrogenase family)
MSDQAPETIVQGHQDIELSASSPSDIANIGLLIDKIALITGGSSGLGRAIAQAYAAAGAFVVSADLSPNPPDTPILAETMKGTDLTTPTVELLNRRFSVKDEKERAVFVECDVTKAECVENAVQFAVRTFGRLDVMVNNAGMLLVFPFVHYFFLNLRRVGGLITFFSFCTCGVSLDKLTCRSELLRVWPPYTCLLFDFGLTACKPKRTHVFLFRPRSICFLSLPSSTYYFPTSIRRALLSFFSPLCSKYRNSHTGIAAENKHRAKPNGDPSIRSRGYLRVHETDPSILDQNWAVNGRGVWLGCKYAAAQMLSQPPSHAFPDRGWIINICSISGMVGIPGASSYSATKGAVLQLTKSIALEYATDRIHVNCINPGFTETAILESMKAGAAGGSGVKLGENATKALESVHPWGRLGRPEDIAKVAVFLAGEGASWVTGQPFVVDGGYTAQ